VVWWQKQRYKQGWHPYCKFIRWLTSKYCQLPGIIGDRFFELLDLNNDEYIDLKEFIHGLFKIYYSPVETKIRLAFDMYDFDKDELVRREDVQLILSYIPIERTVILRAYI